MRPLDRLEPERIEPPTDLDFSLGIGPTAPSTYPIRIRTRYVVGLVLFLAVVAGPWWVRESPHLPRVAVVTPGAPTPGHS